MIAFKIASNILALLAIALICHIISSDFESFRNTIRDIDIIGFTLAAIVAITLNIGTAYLYIRMLNNGNQVETDIPAFFISQMMKYIPGKVWTIGHQKAYYGKSKSTLSIIGANLTLTYYQILLCTIIAISIVALYFSALLTILILSLSIGLISIIKSKPLDYLIRIFQQKTNKSKQTNATLETGFLLVYSILFIIMYILSHTLLVNSVISTTLFESLLIVGTLSAAWVAGLFFVFTPAGIGAREGLIVIFLSAMNLNISLESFAAIALATRAWMLTVDIIPGLFSLIILGTKK